MLEARTAIVDGYNSYFSFSRGRSGYSGLLGSGYFIFYIFKRKNKLSVPYQLTNCDTCIVVAPHNAPFYHHVFTDLPFLTHAGVATYCKDTATPFAAEEGLSGLLSSHEGAVGCYGDRAEFCEDELQLLDNEGRAVITRHRIMYVM